MLRDRGFTGLWLIGLWERSSASKRIKQLCGNPEAAASAYSLEDYEIASNLGGWDALQNLRTRLWQRGIRLASDMVPNHTGMDSKWVVEKPDLFIQRRDNPFPQYTFNGVNLSHDSRVAIYLEDHYYSKNDLAQTMVVAACLLDVPFSIGGLTTLKIKETDRIEALRTELGKLGYELSVTDNFAIEWDGRKMPAMEMPVIATYDDHRMAMSMSLAALRYPGITIANMEVVSKSYPDYWKHLEEDGTRYIFLTNNLTASAETIAELYRNRWSVELFFKWIKQHLRINKFWWTSENAVRIQIYCAIITY